MEKKQSIKKKIAFLLALCMVSNFSIIAGAEDTLSNIDSETENIVGTVLAEDSQNETITTQEDIATETPEIGDVSKVDVVIGLAMFLDKVDFTVTLTSENDFSETNLVILGNENETMEETVSFGNLAEGEYTLKISANGFKTYTQNITVEAQKRYALTLTAGFCEGYAYEIDAIHNGVLLIGDINQDGVIDEEDETILVNAIDDNALIDEYVANGWTTDLNGDGDTDLEDLMFFSKSYKEDGDTTASIEEFISPDLIQAEIPDNIDIEGSFEDMLNGNGSVILTLADNEEVSEESPIAFALDVESDVPVDGISLGLGKNVQTAEFDVAYIDENGEEQVIAVPYSEGVNFLLKESDVTVTRDASGTIQVNLGNQVAVKKVSIKITALMKGSNNLVEISKTEFVNGMEKLVGTPELGIPQNVTAKAGNEEFTLNWKPCNNITGYEILITGGGITKTIETSANSILVKEDDVIKNYVNYTVKI
ncbi:MAG: PEGA domain-containing protein, partial [Oscillospiraceae bacterium]|nr:PEGA domain-containing protein [Oscillospiraceae bacterium]